MPILVKKLNALHPIAQSRWCSCPEHVEHRTPHPHTQSTHAPESGNLQGTTWTAADLSTADGLVGG
eukprot:CAMPEP_0174384324 /NCGR_PEP_ID=MMETSP0811_2-20130205/125838_1 /TAXON_ID=73025 ORGANISM="Eutreptiella gymnastica-like, Strain CCMP1594" /NCGR_SAMPLE_ID=MMETSP0811_2 /ASSEMBLY_ACC=CAM_ASM_000667 /LENGTH=65 /DNA_ID=CAMNT_0015538233 /DNA_START=1367 /DNA_END=1564 /DNA_ORIENTATION=+